MTPRAKAVLEYAEDESRKLSHSGVGAEHILLGLLREEDSVATQVLMNLGLTTAEVMELLDGTVSEPPAPEASSGQSVTASDSLVVSKDTHVFIGMFRPPWSEIQKLERQVINGECKCGCRFACSYVIQYDKLHEHYMRGCFDEPVYKTHEEIMFAMGKHASF